MVMPPTMKKLVGHIAFGESVRVSHFVVPIVPYKTLKILINKEIP